MNDGIIYVWLEKLFGKSWRTSSLGVIEIVAYALTGFQGVLATNGVQVSKTYMIISGCVGLLASLAGKFSTKDKAVTGLDK